MDGKLDTGFTGDFRIGRYASPVAIDIENTADMPRLYFLRAMYGDTASLQLVLGYQLGKDRFARIEELALFHEDLPEEFRGGFVASCTRQDIYAIKQIMSDEGFDMDIVKPFKDFREENRV